PWLARARRWLPQFHDCGRGRQEQAGRACGGDGVHRGGEGLRAHSTRARFDGAEDIANRAGGGEGVATPTRMNSWKWAEQCHIVPSPLAGEGQGEGYNTHCVSLLSRVPTNSVLESKIALATVFVATPLPVPPPQGGRERCGAHLRNSHKCACGSALH